MVSLNGFSNLKDSHQVVVLQRVYNDPPLQYRFSYLIKRVICVLLVLRFLFLGYFYFSPYPLTKISVVSVPKPVSYENDGYLRGYVVYTSGCKIPDMNPMDESVKKYIKRPEKIICNKAVKKVFDSRGDLLLFYKEDLHRYYNVSEGNYTCCYQNLTRDVPKSVKGRGADRAFSYGKECHLISSSETKISDEFIRVICTIKGNSSHEIHKDFLAYVPRKTSARNDNKTKKQDNKDMISVAIFGIDAVSRLNMVRQLPKTHEYLLQNLSAIEMLGYNKVGDNTFPNLIAALTGYLSHELKNVGWNNTNDYFDKCPFIWKKYAELGYKTLFAEDAAWMGLVSYLKNGFFSQPTEYYLRPIMSRMAGEIGHFRDFNSRLCYGHRLAAEFLTSYSKLFCQTFKNDLYFHYVWSASLSHDYLNYPYLEDDILKNMFQVLQDSNSLNNTAFVFMSDHGIRWGGIRSTYQGKLEERLPFLIFVFPKWFKRKYNVAISNLLKNQHRLTSPLDLHETLSDLANLTLIENGNLKQRSDKLLTMKTIPRAISLFLPIPESRTCNQSGIVEHWCTCHKTRIVSKNETIVPKLVDCLIKKLNTMLAPHKQCSNLTLKAINDVIDHIPENNYLKENMSKLRDYTITVQVSPSDAVFEGTVRDNGGKDEPQVIGSISRTNVYGNQSRCVDDYDMKKYCYCP